MALPEVLLRNEYRCEQPSETWDRRLACWQSMFMTVVWIGGFIMVSVLLGNMAWKAISSDDVSELPWATGVAVCRSVEARTWSDGDFGEDGARAVARVAIAIPSGEYEPSDGDVYLGAGSNSRRRARSETLAERRSV